MLSRSSDAPLARPESPPTAGPGWTRLGWDSDFFDMPIGRVELEGRSLDAVEDSVEQARGAGLTCLYGSADPAGLPATVGLQAAGWLHVETATTFDLGPDEASIPPPPGVRVRPGTEADLPALGPMADRLAAWSRFAVDPGFGTHAAARLQRAWVERAARCRSGEYRLLVATDDADGSIVAFITGSCRDRPRVDTVGTSRRGSGAARHLIEVARGWAPGEALLGGPIAARNVPALRYVSHCGYRVCEVRYLYHRWVEPG